MMVVAGIWIKSGRGRPLSVASEIADARTLGRCDGARSSWLSVKNHPKAFAQVYCAPKRPFPG